MLESIDWSRPWLRSVLASHASINDAANWRVSLNHQATTMHVCNALDMPIHFAEQEALLQGVSYETFIYQTGQVPTRDNLHDYFNALVWLSFPRIKCGLNALQATHIERDGIRPARGGARDAATVFDENGTLLVVREGESGAELLDFLRNHQWRQLFIVRREKFLQHCDVWLFGHALMEKLVNPYKAITAHAWPIIASDEYFTMNDVAKQRWIDERVALQLDQHDEGCLTTSCFTPLPVLGMPGWWATQDECFYADEQVFRPKRTQG